MSGHNAMRRVPLFIDIETVPVQSIKHREFLTQHVKPASNLKDPEKIKADIERRQAAIIPETALNGLWGEIVSVAWAVGDEEIRSSVRDPDEPEAPYLEYVSSAICATLLNGPPFNGRAPVWVGFNLGFDTGFLFKRCCLLGIEFSPKIPHNEPSWSEKVIDVQFVWTGRDIKGQSLGKISQAFGFEPKTMDPTEIEFYWHQGALSEIEKYNAHDVELTRDLYRMLDKAGAFR